jgi:TadE-like protein
MNRLRGQSLVEFALVLPIFTMLFAGIIIFGVGVFYQQQLNNAAREAARYASIHSATSTCPTTSRLEPAWNRIHDSSFSKDLYATCDPPDLGWPKMTAHARSHVFGIDASKVDFAACWSGYWDDGPDVDTIPDNWDAPAIADGQPNEFRQCTIGGIDPRSNTAALPCPPPATVKTEDASTTDDKASNLAASGALSANHVTVYACYEWSPPFLGPFVGGTVKMQAVVTEAMQHQR